MKALASRILLLAPVWLVLMTVAALGQTPTASSPLRSSFLDFVLPPQFFGRLFPDLPPYDAPDDATLALLTAAVGPTGGPGPLFDEGTAADNNPDLVPAIFTYFGQFLDHDMTLDTSPLPTEPVDPTQLVNGRDQRLNLDSVFGPRLKLRTELYESGRRLKVNDRDLPRNPDGSAIVGDGRNDENQVIAQLHVAYLRAYNRLLDQGMLPILARTLMEFRHQWIVVHEFLPEVLDPEVYADVFRPSGRIRTRYFDPRHAARAVMPVEFAVAAYRFGHSQVRNAYRITQGGGFVPVFNGTADDLHGGRPIVPEHIIFWPNFVNVDGVPPTGAAGSPVNISRKIDTLLSGALFQLPIPGAEPGGPSILALRNLQRGREYGLPSGQAVAERLGIPALSNADIVASIPRLAMLLDPAFENEAPLWLYCLAESQIVHTGAKLGPVGSRIVAEVIGGLLAADLRSYYRRGWRPPGGVFRLQDLLREAGVL
jgi:hypothetical protein